MPKKDSSPFPPVILVPGIMGSALRDEYPIDPETVWSPFKALIKDYDRLTLHPSDLRYDLQEPARVVADQLFGLIYSELIEELRHNLTRRGDEPVPVFPFAYDWRQPLENIETQLATFVDEVIDRTKLLKHYFKAGYGTKLFPPQVNLVGHSMGGMIVAGYVQANGLGKVARVATIATPFRGSLESVTKTAIGVGALGTSPGSSREREAARVTPALYHLLPSFAGAVTAETGLSADLFQPDSWQPGILQTLQEFIRMYGVDPTNLPQRAKELLTAMLDAAWKNRMRLEKLQVPNPKAWLTIVGVDAETRVSMKIERDSSGKPRFNLADSDVRNEWKNNDATLRVLTGDNTVAYRGARNKFIPTEQVVCVMPGDFSFWEFKDRLLEGMGLHSSLPNMNLVQRLVVSHFKGRPEGDIWGHRPPDLPKGSAWDPPIADLKER